MKNFENPSQIITADPSLEDNNGLNIIKFKGVDGRIKEAVHLSLEGEAAKDLKENDKVQVRGRSGIFTISFGEYLARLGLDHGRYFKAIKTRPEDSLNQILRDLHQEVIVERSEAAKRQHNRYTHESADRDNLQQETAKDHSHIFTHTINDLGIDGLEAEEAAARVDYLDGIDEIVKLDHRSLETDGEESEEGIKIGIQRSFRDKGREVKEDPLRFIPEDPESGPVFRVFVLENVEDYVDMASESSLYQKLLDLRAQKAREAGLDPKTYAKGRRNEGLPTVDKVLPGGVGEQVKRVKRVLKEIRDQLGAYIDSPKFASQSGTIQEALKKQYKQIKIDDFIQAVDELAA